MREILFRAKRKDNGEWVYGDYIRSWHKMNTKPNHMIYNSLGKIEIDHTTVSQYTGLKDKNGTKIFEGDILKHEFDEGNYDLLEVIYDVEGAKFQYRDVKMKGFQFDMVVDIEIVVGNIHDNPELLESEETGE